MRQIDASNGSHMRTAVIKRSNISSSNDHHCGQSHRFHRFPHVHLTLARFYLMTAADFSRPDRSVYFSTLRARATQFRLQFLRSISTVNQTQNWIPFALPPHPITHLGKVCFALCVRVCCQTRLRVPGADVVKSDGWKNKYLLPAVCRPGD